MKDLARYRGWALITGASSGLGAEFARQIARQGVDCVLVGLGGEALDAMSGELTEQFGVACRPIELNLAGAGAVERLQKSTEDIPVGLLVNCAGMAHGGAFAERDPRKLEDLAQLNCVAPMLLTRAYLPQMLERGAGGVIIVASLQAFVSCPFETAYCASKAFLLHFGESLWGELRGTPIDCLTLCPAGMKTDFFKAEGFSEADCKRMWRVSSSPSKVAALGLRKLGRQAVAAPLITHATALLVRFLPRRWSIDLVRFVTRQLVDHQRL